MPTRPAFGSSDGREIPDLVGQILAGKYHIIRLIGEGGFGRVYEATNLNLSGQRLAIKVPYSAKGWNFQARDAEILCRLDHQNICRVIDFVPDAAAVVMQFVEGEDCQDLMEKQGMLSDHLLLSIMNALADAVRHAHDQRIAHRDLKPGNIIITPKGQPVLIDFGIAKHVKRDSQDSTKTGPLTYGYAAPERISNPKGYDPFLSDIFEFGFTLFCLATGQKPYSSLYDGSQTKWDVKIRKRLDRRFEAVLRKATAISPSDRFQSMDEMAAALGRVQRIHSPRRLTVRLAAAFALFTLGAVAAVNHQIINQVTRDIAASFRGESSSASVDQDSLVALPPPSAPPGVVSEQPSDDTPPPMVNNPPQINITGRSSVSVGESLQLTIEATDPDGTVPNLGVDGEIPRNAEWIRRSGSKGELMLTPDSLQAGSIRVTFVAKDDEKTTSKTHLIRVDLPVLQSPDWTIRVKPDTNTTLRVDGIDRPIGLSFPIAKGGHWVEVRNPGFPIFEDSLRISVSAPTAIDLDSVNSGRETAVIRIFGHGLDGLSLKANGFIRPLIKGSFGTRHVELQRGKWELEFIVPGGADSLVVFDKTSDRIAHPGSRLTIDLFEPRYRGKKEIELSIMSGK